MENLMKHSVSLLILATVLGCGQGTANVLDAKSYHLRSGTVAEWEEFEGKTPHGSSLDVKFQAKRNRSDATLFLRQYNVKQEWPVLINDQKIGILFLMEDPLTSTLRIPAGVLKDGENTLSIIPPKENDDVVIGEIELVDSPPAKAFTGNIEIAVLEGSKPVPCRITIVDDQKSLAALHVAETSNGRRSTRRRLQCRRSLQRLGCAREYTRSSRRAARNTACRTKRCRSPKAKRCVSKWRSLAKCPTPGLVSSDTHVHTFTHAKHGDATIHERMLTIAGEALELPISTEHNMLADFAAPAKAAGVQQHFTPVLGCEVTTKRGHFNVFPILPESRVPDFRLEHWPALMENIRATPGVQFVVLNHPRDVHAGFCPFAETNFNAQTGENLRGFEFSFDGVELINSGALRTDLMQVFHDWFALLNYGYKIVGVGASDSHDVSRFIVGQGRTYIMCDDKDPSAINVAEAIANLRKGKALISLGLITKLKVEDRFEVGDLATNVSPQMNVKAEVWGPSWVTADRIELFANGKRIAQSAIEPSARPQKFSISWTLPRPKTDAHLIAIATGPGVRSPHWAIPRPYQASSPKWNPRVLGATNPIWIDADGDGKFTPLRLQTSDGRN